uniref:Activin types I and II receptor domain-containing protein n=1 Tax=Fundulus heteroclitus TaxID=8078 RepID=A0A3Q2UN97_FUNHE
HERHSNLLDAMLLGSGWKGGSSRPVEDSSDTAPVLPENLLRCHCYPQCPDGSVNNTCTTNGFCFTMIEEVERGQAQRSAGCLPGSEFQCRDTQNARSRRAIECCKDHDYCNRNLNPMLPPLVTSGSLSYTVKLSHSEVRVAVKRSHSGPRWVGDGHWQFKLLLTTVCCWRGEREAGGAESADLACFLSL